MDAEENARRRAVLQSHILTMLFELNEDELLVVEALLERVSGQGLETYGHLDIATDTRDFAAEAHAEDLDATWYRAVEHVKRGHAHCPKCSQMQYGDVQITDMRNSVICSHCHRPLGKHPMDETS
jgi:hypothetical protein